MNEAEKTNNENGQNGAAAEAETVRKEPVQQAESVREPAAAAAVDTENARKMTLVVYGLYAASVLVVITSIVGVILAYMKKDEMQGTVYYSHMQYLIKTFLGALAGTVVGSITSFIFIGSVIFVATGIWFIYRVVMGFLKFQNNEAVSTEGWF